MLLFALLANLTSVVLLAARSFMSSSLRKGCCSFRMEMLGQVCYSCLALMAAGFCFLVSSTGLVEGPLCLHNSTEGAVWDKPLQGQRGSYLSVQVSWVSLCEEPQGVVLWNVVLFSVLMALSGMQILLCAAQTLNTMLGLFCGHTFGRNKVSPA